MPSIAYVFGGMRPSSGAATLKNDAAWKMSDALERAEFAAAEDGRTPVNGYLIARLGEPTGTCSYWSSESKPSRSAAQQ